MSKTRRNPNEILADLNEALRHKRIANLSFASGHPDTRQWSMLPYQYKTDLCVPAFDFGSYADGAYVFSQAALDAGWKMFMRDELRLPFPRCIFIATGLTDAHPGTRIDNVLLLDQTDENEITVTIFDEEWGAKPLRYPLPDGKIVTWAGNTQSVHISTGTIHMLAPADRYNGFEEDLLQDKKWASDIADMVLSGLAILALPGTESREAPPTLISQAVNRGRQHGKLLPLPLVRTIHVDRAAHAHSHGTGNGSPVRPHFRRGHWRTLADGRRVPVKEARIHGGPSDAAPPIYAVV